MFLHQTHSINKFDKTNPIYLADVTVDFGAATVMFCTDDNASNQTQCGV